MYVQLAKNKKINLSKTCRPCSNFKNILILVVADDDLSRNIPIPFVEICQIMSEKNV